MAELKVKTLQEILEEKKKHRLEAQERAKNEQETNADVASNEQTKEEETEVVELGVFETSLKRKLDTALEQDSNPKVLKTELADPPHLTTTTTLAPPAPKYPSTHESPAKRTEQSLRDTLLKKKHSLASAEKLENRLEDLGDGGSDHGGTLSLSESRPVSRPLSNLSTPDLEVYSDISLPDPPTHDEEEDDEDEDDAAPPRFVDYYPAAQGCRSVECYERLNRIEEGTYGVVHRAKSKDTGEVVALKKLKLEKDTEDFSIVYLREIVNLIKMRHENIVQVKEIVVGHVPSHIYIVMEYLEHDLKSLLEGLKQPLLQAEVKCLMTQLLRGMAHLHNHWIIHRDLKTSNLLLNHQGILKIGDFGLAREYGSPLRPYTPLVVTLWYRGPELLLGEKLYTTSLDMWSIGCIFSEFLTTKPLFPGKGEIDTLQKIFKLLGTPNDSVWEGYSSLPYVKKFNFAQHPSAFKKEYTFLSSLGRDLLLALLCYDPHQRISADEALEHDYFRESPLAVPPEMFPHFPARSEGAHKKRSNTPQAPKGQEGGRSPTLSEGGHDLDSDLAGQGGFLFGSSEKTGYSGPSSFALKF